VAYFFHWVTLVPIAANVKIANKVSALRPTVDTSGSELADMATPNPNRAMSSNELTKKYDLK